MDFVELMKTFGFPVTAVAVLGLAVWRSVVYITTQILKPLADRHLLFIDHLERSQEAQENTANKQAESAGKQADLLVRMVEIQNTLSRQLQEQTILLRSIGATSAVQTKIMVQEHAEAQQQQDGGSGTGHSQS